MARCSPLLFVLAEDFLSRYLARLINRGELISMTLTCSRLAPTHFLYVDDLLLFARASDSNIRVIMDAFNRYGVLSGQMVNWDKFFIHFGEGVSSNVADSLLALSHMLRGSSVLTYIGIPLFVGMPRGCWIKPIADKIKNRLISWKGSKLSFTGRLCLINYVIKGHFAY